VQPLAIVEHFDIIEQGCFCLFEGLEPGAVDAPCLQLGQVTLRVAGNGTRCLSLGKHAGNSRCFEFCIIRIALAHKVHPDG